MNKVVRNNGLGEEKKVLLHQVHSRVPVGLEPPDQLSLPCSTRQQTVLARVSSRTKRGVPGHQLAGNGLFPEHQDRDE